MVKVLSATYTAVIIVLCLIIVIQFTELGNPVKDYFAHTVDAGTVYLTQWVNSTDYIYVPQWINNTTYINVLYWVNETIWVNTTLYVPIWYNTTEYINYPFIAGWNISSDLNYLKVFKSGPNYRFDFRDQLDGQLYSTNYGSATAVKNTLLSLLGSGRITTQQYDAGLLQLYILQG